MVVIQAKDKVVIELGTERPGVNTEPRALLRILRTVSGESVSEEDRQFCQRLTNALWDLDL